MKKKEIVYIQEAEGLYERRILMYFTKKYFDNK